MTGEPVTSAPDLSTGTRRLAILLAMAMFVLVVDTSVMNVSIASVVHDLHTTVSGVQSAIALEALVSAAFILIGSKVGDLIGRKRAYVLGLLGYGIGALAMALAQGLVARLRCLPALLGKARADHKRGADALAAAFLQGRRDIGRRDDDNGEVGRLRQFGDARVAPQAKDFRLTSRDRVDTPRVAVGDQELRRAAAQAVRIGGGANDCDAVRGEERGEVGHPLSAGRDRAR